MTRLLALALLLLVVPLPAEPLRVMSFNIRNGKADDGPNNWVHRRELVAETIRTFDPDLLGLQEAYEFQCRFLRERLAGYAFHGVGREDGKRRGEFVPILYREKRFELLDSGHRWLSETPTVAGSKSWDSSLPRMMSWVKLHDRTSGQELVFANVHFDHRGTRARLESAKLLRAFWEELGPDTAFVLAGDFNTTETKLPYAALIDPVETEGPRLIDSHRAAHPERAPDETTFSAWNGRREGQRIDWIVHSHRFATRSARINRHHENGRYPSDHYPVQAVLAWR